MYESDRYMREVMARWGRNSYEAPSATTPTPKPLPPVLEFTSAERGWIATINTLPAVAFSRMQEKFDSFYPYRGVRRDVWEGALAGKINLGKDRSTEVDVWVGNRELELNVRTSSGGVRYLREALSTSEKLQEGLKVGSGLFNFRVVVGLQDPLAINASWEDHSDERQHFVQAGTAFGTPEFLAQLVEVVETAGPSRSSLEDYRPKKRGSFVDPRPLVFADEEVLRDQDRGTLYFNQSPMIDTRYYEPEPPRAPKAKAPDPKLEARERARREINQRLRHGRR
jgi:hypothetical protein